MSIKIGSNYIASGGTTDYSDLDNKPTINGVGLTGDLSLDDLSIQAKGDYATSQDLSTGLAGKQDSLSSSDTLIVEDNVVNTNNIVWRKW